jgi:hypothetical protein
MLRIAFRLLTFAVLGLAVAAGRADAAEMTAAAPQFRSEPLVAPPAARPAPLFQSEAAVADPAARPVPPPRVQYGCKRIWRCDAQVCEWRRGCWGIYGYMEGPYYNLELARRQWERDGWPVPRRYRDR